MNFVSPEFLLFFLVVLALWRVSSAYSGGRPYILTGASLLFYAAAGPAYLPLLPLAALWNWGAGRLLARFGKAKLVAAVGIAGNLGLLCFFKYSEFLFTGLQAAAGFSSLSPTLVLPDWFADLVFPVGISFYTFQGIAYIADLYSGKEPAPRSFGEVLAYLSFFPTVLAGPIMRPGRFFSQLAAVSGANPPAGRAAEGFALILSGLFKKVALAGFLSEQLVRDPFQGPEGFSSIALLLAVYGYSLQIYCDFSGYTDMALGVGRLLGFDLPENFNSPYLARNLQDFWRRWHITLSSWLRDYLYIPLGGSRKGSRSLNLLLTMLLGGLWHGAHVRFLVWGGLHGLGLCVVHALQTLRKKDGPEQSKPSAVAAFFSGILTFHFVSFAWIFFRAEDMDKALEIIRRIVGFNSPGDGVPLMSLPVLAAAFAVQLIGPRFFPAIVRGFAGLPAPALGAAVAAVAALIFRMGPEGMLPFIYFSF